MRPLVLTSWLLPAALLAGCSADSIQGPSPSAGPALARGGANPEFTYTTIEVTGALATTAFGINARGDIVGSYVDASFRSHGFLLRDGGVTTIDYPGAAGNDARGIGPNGEIVGGYWMPGEPGVNIHGYLRTKQGDFERVDYPGHTNTIPQRILGDGTILGCRHDHNTMDTMRGIVMGRDGNSEIDANASMHNGATPNGKRIVGLYMNMDAGNRTEGYVIEDGVFTPFLVPGSNFTAAWDMNPVGDIVGIYRTGTVFHGFLLRDGRYVSIDVPGATATRAFGTNAGGAIVGSYIAGGRTRGFLATPN
jgi:uncharacterized membrane protein